jgi:hypothetical protein
VITWIAVIVGGAVPLVVLAAIARWRGGPRPRRVVPQRQPRRRGERRSLAWLGANLGKPMDGEGGVPLGPDSEAKTTDACPACGHRNEEGALFCRRCGNVLPQ